MNNTAIEFLNAHHVFHLATVDDGQARVRPFGFAMKRNDALYMCTNTTKDVFRQLLINPDIEICAMGTDGTWLRVRGRVTVDYGRDAKVQAFAEAPQLLSFYPKGADDETFVTFYFVEARATLYSFDTPPKDIPLL